jgi:hypothetical protein
MERITALQHDLDTLVMSAEKEYRTRFEISDLKYTLLQREVDELKQVVEARGERGEGYVQDKKNSKPVDSKAEARREVHEIRQRINILRVMKIDVNCNPDECRKIDEEIFHLGLKANKIITDNRLDR